MTILIVEDNASVRRLIRVVVGDLADSVFECADGMDAMAAYDEHRPDFVLMDIEMKRLDGIQATRRIVAGWPAAKIIVLSNHDDAGLREAAEKAGACGYVRKENLLEIVSLLR
ncbi:MAG: response regulator transcription factor [Acidobacteriota bacterium]|nr:response regulator transcription factor [Acidobacteriota bacterium]